LIGYTPEQMERSIKLFSGRTRQFVFISSASAYQKPSTNYLITESTPLSNPIGSTRATRSPAKTG